MILATEVPDVVLSWALLLISTTALGMLGWLARETIKLRNDFIAHMGREEAGQARQDKALTDLEESVEACRQELHDGLAVVHSRVDAALAQRSA